MRMENLGIGIIGCGNISAAYLKLAPLFRGLEIRAVADLNMAAAQARGAEFGVAAQSVEDLLGNPLVDVVVNLTVPQAHFAVSRRILQAGKHVYSEKPLVLTLEQGVQLRDLAAAKGLFVGCAPDTFLGTRAQQARALIDAGALGVIASGSAAVLSHGPESWHPNPEFFYAPGAGPMMDMGPYYIASLINLLGPVRRVGALTSSAMPSRVIGSGPREGQEFAVKTPSTIRALLEFHSGAQVGFEASWDVWHHKRSHFELYGTEGTLYLPDPNFFGGSLEMTGRDGVLRPVAPWDHPFGVDNDLSDLGPVANYRTAGLADMVAAVLAVREARCSLARALHAVEVMTACLASGESGAFVTLTTSCTRPEALDPSAARGLMRERRL